MSSRRYRYRQPVAVGRIMIAGAAFCATLLILAACGSRASTGLGSHSGEPTSTPAVVVRVTVAATAISTATLKIPDGVTNCGYVFEGAMGTQPANALDIENCFYKAFQSCQPAALLDSTFGVDTQENYLFVVQPGANGACGIALTVKAVGCCGSTSHLIKLTDSCAAVVKQNNAYVVTACGKQGNIPLPS